MARVDTKPLGRIRVGADDETRCSTALSRCGRHCTLPGRSFPVMCARPVQYPVRSNVAPGVGMTGGNGGRDASTPGCRVEVVQAGVEAGPEVLAVGGGLVGIDVLSGVA